MACLHPVQVKAKEKGAILAPCNHCRECLIQNVKDWSFRLKEELKSSQNAFFLTLTYSDKDPEYTGKLEKSHIRRFLKRLRNFTDYQYKTTRQGSKVPQIAQKPSNLRFFAVGEFGDKFKRPHYHMLIFNVPTFREPQSIMTSYMLVEELFSKCWSHGFVHIGKVEQSSINYVCKYIFKTQGDKFRIMSKNPTIGFDYIEKMKEYYMTPRLFTHGEGGKKLRIPSYYKKKLINDETRAKAKEKADKFINEKRKEIFLRGNLRETFDILRNNHEFELQQDESFKTQKR